MNKDDRIRLHHLLDAAHEAVAFIQTETRESLDNDHKLLLALVKDTEIIGKAASRISEALQQTTPEIPWAQIVGMRNRLIHAYFNIDGETVWKTITEDLPPLIAEPENIIHPEENT